MDEQQKRELDDLRRGLRRAPNPIVKPGHPKTLEEVVRSLPEPDPNFLRDIRRAYGDNLEVE